MKTTLFGRSSGPLQLLIGTFALAACGAETGNGLAPRTSSVSMGLTSSTDASSSETAGFTGPDADGAILRVRSARASIGWIELHMDGTGCGEVTTPTTASCDAGKLRFAGPFVADLVSGRLEPSLDDVVLPAVAYRRVDVRLEKGRVFGKAPGIEQTLTATGTLERNGTSTPFDLALDFNAEAKFDDAAGVDLSGGPSGVLLQLDVGAWFAGAPISGCYDDGELVLDGGRLHIVDANGRCRQIRQGISAAIKDSGRLRAGPDRE
jgi:hypothetical protein